MEKLHKDQDFSHEASYTVNIRDSQQSVKMEHLISKYKNILTVVAAHWVFSFIFVLTLSISRSDEDFNIQGLNAPQYETWVSCILIVLVYIVWGAIGEVFPNFVTIPKVKFDPRRLRATLPLSVMFVFTVILNHMCLISFDSGVCSMGQSLTLAFSVIYTLVILHQDTSVTVLMLCAVIVTTDFITAEQEEDFFSGPSSVTTIFLDVIASAVWALKDIYVKKTLPLVDNSVWQLTFYVSLNSVFLLSPLMIFYFVEAKDLQFYSSSLTSLRFWKYTILPGVIASAISFTINLEIHVTSALTHTISQRAKVCLLTFLGSFYFENEQTGLWWLSNLLILFGGAAYAEVRREEMTTRHLESLMVTKKQEQTAEKLALPREASVSMIKVPTLDSHAPSGVLVTGSSPLRLHSLGLL